MATAMKSSSSAKVNSTSTGKMTLTGKGAPTKGVPGKGLPGKAPTKPTGMGKVFMGMMMYVIGSYALQTGLIYLNFSQHWNLQKDKLFTIGGFTLDAFSAIFMVGLVGLLWGLYKFKVLPSGKDLAAQRAASTVVATGKGGALNGKLSSNKAVTANNNKATTAGKPSANGKTAEPVSAGVKSQKTINGENDDLYLQAKAQQRALARKGRKR